MTLNYILYGWIAISLVILGWFGLRYIVRVTDEVREQRAEQDMTSEYLPGDWQ